LSEFLRRDGDNRKFISKIIEAFEPGGSEPLQHCPCQRCVELKKNGNAGEKIAALDSKSARRIAADALRDLKSDTIRKRLKS
jgi:hypothetical protein